jgi:hypothetical protein
MRDEIGAAVVIDHALGPPGGAGGVVERDRFPLVLGHNPLEIIVSFGQKLVVGQVAAGGVVARALVRDLDDEGEGFGLHLLQRRLDGAQELRVAEHDLGLAVVEDVGNRADVQADIDGVQDGAAGRDAEMRLHVGVGVRQNGRHDVAGIYSAFREA